MSARPISGAIRVVHYPGNVKRCSRCGEVKALDQFTEQIARSNGWKGAVTFLRRCSQCRECRRITNREHYARVGFRARRARLEKERQGRRHLEAVPPPSKPTEGPELAPAVCVCGATRAQHRAFKGACGTTGCPAFMEKGC